MSDAYILSAELDRASFERLDALRRAHFPPERNVLSAHLTLFHALPGERLGALREELERAAAARPPCPFTVAGLMRLGGGVAYRVESPALRGVRAGLADAWAPWLTAQDAQGFRPHVTVQNKVPREAAGALHDELAADFAPWDGEVGALLLWRYAGGPWEAVGRHELMGRTRPAGPFT